MDPEPALDTYRLVYLLQNLMGAGLAIVKLHDIAHRVPAGMSQMSAQLTSESKQYAQRSKDLYRQVIAASPWQIYISF